MSEEKTYTRQEMDVIMKKHILDNAETLRKNLKEKASKNIDYV